MADIKVKNIYYMLSYASQTLRETGFANVASEDFDHVHDLFAAILVQGIGAQVKRGLHKDYIQREEALAGLRGRIRIADTIKRQTQPLGKLACAFDEFIPDSPHNQALKSVMLLLLRHGNVKPENKKALRKLIPYFGDVGEAVPASIRWDALKYHRNNASYRMLLGICRLTVKGLLLKTEAGVNKLSTWLQDGEMHRLYEKFVLSYYLRHHPEYLPKAAFIDWDIPAGDDRAYLPIMRTDITLQHGGKRLIIDAKYYGKTMQVNALHDSRTFISSNLYQIYAYVKNSDKASSGNVAGALLYAKTDEAITPDADYMMGGNRIILKTLDLDCDWEVITGQLERLCDWLSPSERG
jgi:5-methylcytosine-specific restriction enzyme subunit McrC